MELKNIFKMTKTDRYTQDGRDELAKLQETEDVKYKTGDISQKTGLQKQPDGSWAPPKNAGKNVHGAEIDKIYEKHQKRIKELKAKGYTDEQIENDKIYQQTKEDMKNVGKSKPAENKPALTQTEFVKQKMEQYKDLSPEQKKDAMYAASYEGITIGGTQNGMERAGWDLVQADDDVNVYAKPDGSKITMKHDGKRITSTEYEAPENKPADMLSSKDPAILNKYKPETEEEENEIKKMQQFMEEETGATLRNAILARESYYNNSPSEYKNEAGKAALSNIKKIFGYGTQKDSAPRQLTGDCKIRIRK